MFTKEGYWNVVPQVKSVLFPIRGKWQINLVDGRSVVIPISAFPGLKKVPVHERSQW